MDLLVIVSGVAFFVACLSVHIMIWRLRHPKHQALSLFVIFLVTPVICNIIFFNSLHNNGQSGIMKDLASLGLGDFLLIYLLHFALSAAYILSYPAAQAGCPTFIILAIINSAMPHGVTKDEIMAYFSERQLFDERIHDLVSEKLILDRDGWLEITPKGRLIISIFSTLRKAFGLPAGKG